jgi:predicted glycosyltransferase
MMHDALFYATLFVSDTQTSTTEAACLGTPAIRCNSFVGSSDMSNFKELEEKYRLIFNYRDSDMAIDKAVELLNMEDLKNNWHLKRDVLLKDKIDVTAFMTWLIENYPQSVVQIKQNPNLATTFYQKGVT